MQIDDRLIAKAFNYISPQVAMVDFEGNIIYVNRTWVTAGAARFERSWTGDNYFDVCRRAIVNGDPIAAAVYHAMRQVASGDTKSERIDYPCHSPTEQRWFEVLISRIEDADVPVLLVSHTNITARKIAARKLTRAALEDSLTGLANRRHFDSLINREWARSRRNSTTIHIAVLDVDKFKLVNDRYGHAAGDQALIDLATTMRKHLRRPSDISARFGGDEFVMCYCGATTEYVEKTLRSLSDEFSDFPDYDRSASIGCIEVRPSWSGTAERALSLADQCLYRAKREGKGQVSFIVRA